MPRTRSIARREVAEGVSLYRADCLDFLRSLDDESIDVITTDPPYSVRCFDAFWKKEKPAWSLALEEEPGIFRAFLLECRRVLRADGHIYVMFGSSLRVEDHHLVRDVVDISAQTDGETSVGRERESIVFTKVGGRWLAIHEHLSPQ